MSSPSEPVDTVSTSIDLSFLPSRIIEPLPKLRSICESAASRAFDLSMEEPSTTRSAAVAIAPTPYDRDSRKTNNDQHWEQCTLFVLCSQYVLRQFVLFSRATPSRHWPPSARIKSAARAYEKFIGAGGSHNVMTPDEGKSRPCC